MLVTIKDSQGKITQFSQAQKLNDILMGFKNAVEKHNTSVVIIIEGKSGLGKSTLANQIAKTLDKNYGLHKMHWKPETFCEGGGKVGLATAKVGDGLVLDESAPISNRSSLSKLNRTMTQALTMVRSKQVYLIFCINSYMDLDKNIAIFRSDLVLHLYGQTIIDRGKFAAFFKGRDKIDRIKLLYIYGKKLYDYSRPKANFTSKFSKAFIVDEKEYEKQKNKGVNEFLMGGAVEDTKKPRNQLMKYVITKKLLSVKEVAEISIISTRQVYNILKEDNKKILI